MEEKISEPTQDWFIEKLGDTVTIQLEVTKDADKLVGELMKSINKGTEWKPGLKVKTLYFKGKDPTNIVNQSKQEVLDFLQVKLDEMSRKLKNEEGNNIAGLT